LYKESHYCTIIKAVKLKVGFDKSWCGNKLNESTALKRSLGKTGSGKRGAFIPN
jgi:hypothetical protein